MGGRGKNGRWIEREGEGDKESEEEGGRGKEGE